MRNVTLPVVKDTDVRELELLGREELLRGIRVVDKQEGENAGKEDCGNTLNQEEPPPLKSREYLADDANLRKERSYQPGQPLAPSSPEITPPAMMPPNAGATVPDV